MKLVDLYALHEQKASVGRLTVHPSRWLYAGRAFGSVFNFFAKGEEVVHVGDNIARNFKQLSELRLHSNMRFKHGHYLASETIATRYMKYTPSGSTLECAVRDVLAVSDHEAHIEVHTPVGYIDLMSRDVIVEVKSLKKWKQALGQVLAYSLYYPNHSRIIHLFGQASAPNLLAQTHICSAFNVTLRYQQILQGGHATTSILNSAATGRK